MAAEIEGYSVRFLSTFSGIGGMEKGLENAGWECAGQVEIDAACQHWLGVHWPNVPKWRDIKTLTGDAVRARCGRIDALVGGPPCQPASVAGKRQGSADDRWLWPDFLRLGRELSPKWILAENPTGIVTLKPHGLDWIMSELEAAGYQPFPVVMGADDIGAPHRRKRVWIVAHASRDAMRQRPDCGADRERAWESGHTPLADSDGGRREGERSGGLLDGERPTHGDDSDRRGERPVGEPTGAGLEVGPREEDDRGTVREAGRSTLAPGGELANPERPGRGERGEPEAACANRPGSGPRNPLRWPARPGEPQHPWEAPRLAHTYSTRRAKAGIGHPLDAAREPEPGRGEIDDSPSEPDPGLIESGVGDAVDELPRRVAGLRTSYTSAHRREALKALGNAVVPAVVEAIGRAIMRLDQ